MKASFVAFENDVVIRIFVLIVIRTPIWNDLFIPIFALNKTQK